MLSDEEDRALVRDTLGGDKEAFGLIVEKYKVPIYNLAFKMTNSREDALDIAQETFLKSYEHVASFDLKRRFFPWIYTLCLNLCRNHLKKKAGKEVPFEETYAPNIKTGKSGAHSYANPENLTARGEAEASLRSAIASLPEEYRAPLILRYSEGLSFQEISEILSLTVGAAKMRVRRGIEMLRELIPKEEEDG